MIKSSTLWISNYLFPLSFDNYQHSKLLTVQQRWELGLKIMKIRNIVQSQIIDFWFFRIIYYLPLFFIYTNAQKIKDLKEIFAEEAHPVNQNQFSWTDSRIPKIANADAICLWIATVCRAEYDTAPKLSVETWNVLTTYVPKNDHFPCLSQSPMFSRNRKQILGRSDKRQSWQTFPLMGQLFYALQAI